MLFRSLPRTGPDTRNKLVASLSHIAGGAPPGCHLCLSIPTSGPPLSLSPRHYLTTIPKHGRLYRCHRRHQCCPRPRSRDRLDPEHVPVRAPRRRARQRRLTIATRRREGTKAWMLCLGYLEADDGFVMRGGNTSTMSTRDKSFVNKRRESRDTLASLCVS